VGVWSILKDTVKERNLSPMGKNLQVAHNFNIISGFFSPHVIKITVSLHSFLLLVVLRFKNTNFFHQIYAVPSIIAISI